MPLETSTHVAPPSTGTGMALLGDPSVAASPVPYPQQKRAPVTFSTAHGTRVPAEIWE